MKSSPSPVAMAKLFPRWVALPSGRAGAEGEVRVGDPISLSNASLCFLRWVPQDAGVPEGRPGDQGSLPSPGLSV